MKRTSGAVGSSPPRYIYKREIPAFDEIYSYWRRSDNLARRIYLADDQGTEYGMERKARSSWDFSENRYGRHRSVVAYFTQEGPETFYGFSVSTGFLRPKGTGSHWRTDGSGEMEYSIPVKENRDSITLMLHDPIYQVEGPWSFTFPVVPR